MERKEFIIETITPLFCHGDGKENLEMRAPSIKGLLRYWWRIMKLNENQTIDLRTENEIFGSTDKRSTFKLQIILGNENFISEDEIRRKIHNNPGLKYAWWNGPVYRDRNVRGDQFAKMIYPARYRIIFNFYNNINNEILKSFYYLIKYGGIGGKNRRGAGKFIFINNELNNGIAFNRLNLLKFTYNFSSWEAALNFLGEVYKIYRRNKRTNEKYYLGSAEFRDKKRIPSKVIFEIFKQNNNYSAGYLLLCDEINNNNLNNQLQNFKNYLLRRQAGVDSNLQSYLNLKNLSNFSFTEVTNE